MLFYRNLKFTDCTVPAIVDDPENDNHDVENFKETISDLFNSDNTSNVFTPQYVRLKPPLYYDAQENEMLWLWPNDSGNFLSSFSFKVLYFILFPNLFDSLELSIFIPFIVVYSFGIVS